jgi:hypothetical protein
VTAGPVDSQRQGWADVCAGYWDLRADANLYGLDQRWRQLRAATSEGRARLDDWLDLQQSILARAAYDGGTVREGLDLPIGGQDADDDDEETGREYGCPVGRCARVEHELPDGPPWCNLRGLRMTPR